MDNPWLEKNLQRGEEPGGGGFNDGRGWNGNEPREVGPVSLQRSVYDEGLGSFGEMDECALVRDQDFFEGCCGNVPAVRPGACGDKEAQIRPAI